ncbi:MAG: transketolase family protein [Patescibacteria group bacterium]|nr:transketolase family protein [Patescibacteria group bacterium]
MNLSPRIFKKNIDMVPTRNGYGDALVELGRKNPNVVVLCADLSDSTRSSGFQKEFPERFIECGIAEQNMMGMAAGLASEGKIPFVSTYSVFCPGRNWDQLRVSACYSNLPVKLTGAHAGVSVGPDGATHQGLEDIAITRCIPNLTVLAPCDYEETRKATVEAAKLPGPVYLRFAREKTPVFTTSRTPFKIGRAEVLREGKDVSVVACGPLVYEALLVAEKLKKEQIKVEVIDSHTIKPLDKKTILKSAKKTGAIITVEEHQIMGGMGSAVAEVLARNYPVPMEFVGMPDSFGESGAPEELLKKYGMTSARIIKAIKKVLKRK